MCCCLMLLQRYGFHFILFFAKYNIRRKQRAYHLHTYTKITRKFSVHHIDLWSLHRYRTNTLRIYFTEKLIEKERAKNGRSIFHLKYPVLFYLWAIDTHECYKPKNDIGKKKTNAFSDFSILHSFIQPKCVNIEPI